MHSNRPVLPITPIDPRDGGRRQTLLALGLILAAPLLLVVVALANGHMPSIAFELARLLAWAAVLCLTYLGFAMVRAVLALFVLITAASSITLALGPDAMGLPAQVAVTLLMAASQATGAGLLILHKRIRAFLDLQGERTGYRRSGHEQGA